MLLVLTSGGMVCNGELLLYLYGLVFGPNWISIGYLQINSSYLFIFHFYRGPTYPVKCIVEMGG